MFGKIKKILGIEDVKIELRIPEEVKEKSGEINGTVIITSFKESQVESIEIKLVEKYSRGRWKDKLIDEYKIGEISLDDPIHIYKEDIIELPFSLPFRLVKSDVEKFGDKNPIFGGIASVAKTIRGVKSTYYVEAQALVIGTKLHPIAKADIVIK